MEKIKAAIAWLRERFFLHTHVEEDLFGKVYCASIGLGPVALHIGIERR